MKKSKRNVILFTVVFILLVLSLVAVMNLKNTNDLQAILEESVKSQLISISVAARELIDVNEFITYNSADVTAEEGYQKTLEELRALARNVGAQYIYALKEKDGEAYFVFDTDTEDTEVFIPYDLSPVHEAAFLGEAAADVMNVEDEYGTFNTGAVPIKKNGRVVGIVAADLEDEYLQASLRAGTRNGIILIVTMVVAMGVLLFVVVLLMNRVKTMQQRLQHQAHHDVITGLPNRQYLLEYLEGLTRRKTPFALMFIDLDNFKQVNDNAGHEAGDELLRHIANYLHEAGGGAMAFRPTAGKLNIAARIGGDEFVQVLVGVETEAQAAEMAQKLLDGFAHIKIDRYIEKYNVGMSIGVALWPYHTESYHVLIQYADVAMYNAKRAGKNRFFVYQDEMSHE